MIRREPDESAAGSHDLVVIGGGVQGITLTLEAALAGFRTLLLERDDFGAATSWNHQRILHGGFRYLQSGALRRYSASVRERRWFMRHFPELVRPLPCLLPLYGKGLRRAPLLRAALPLNDLLSAARNRGVDPSIRLPRGSFLSRDQVLRIAPGIAGNGLEGGALWYDAVMTSSRRVLVEMLHWAAAAGARALNYVEATDLRESGGRVAGVEAVDRVSGRELAFPAAAVVNCAGPWSRQVATRFDTDVPRLFRPLLAYLLYLDVAPPADIALAVDPPGPDSRTYFLFPWQDGVLAGTEYVPWDGPLDDPEPSPHLVSELVRRLATAIPSWGLSESHVRRVHAGLIPGRPDGSADSRDRDILYDHGAGGGPEGLYSVSGVKFTTARRLAPRVLRRLGAPGGAQRRHVPRPPAVPNLSLPELRSLMDRDPGSAREHMRRLVEDESVIYLDDLLLRRVDWVEDPAARDRAVGLVGELLPVAPPRPKDRPSR